MIACDTSELVAAFARWHTPHDTAVAALRSTETNWYRWHGAYDDPRSPLSRWLRLVQLHIAEWLDHRPGGPLRVVSVCARQDHDLLPVLHTRADSLRVQAFLLEADAAVVGIEVETPAPLAVRRPPRCPSRSPVRARAAAGRSRRGSPTGTPARRPAGSARPRPTTATSRQR